MRYDYLFFLLLGIGAVTGCSKKDPEPAPAPYVEPKPSLEFYYRIDGLLSPAKYPKIEAKYTLSMGREEVSIKTGAMDVTVDGKQLQERVNMKFGKWQLDSEYKLVDISLTRTDATGNVVQTIAYDVAVIGYLRKDANQPTWTGYFQGNWQVSPNYSTNIIGSLRYLEL